MSLFGKQTIWKWNCTCPCGCEFTGYIKARKDPQATFCWKCGNKHPWLKYENEYLKQQALIKGEQK